MLFQNKLPQTIILILFIITAYSSSYQSLSSPFTAGTLKYDVELSSGGLLYARTNYVQGVKIIQVLARTSKIYDFSLTQILNPSGNNEHSQFNSDHSIQVSKNSRFLSYLDRNQKKINIYQRYGNGLQFLGTPTRISTSSKPFNGDFSTNFYCVVFRETPKVQLYGLYGNSLYKIQDLTFPPGVNLIAPHTCSISKDQTKIAVADIDGAVFIFNLDNQGYYSQATYSSSLTTQFTKHYSLRFSGDSKIIYLASNSGVQYFIYDCVTDTYGPSQVLDANCQSRVVEVIGNGQYAYISCYCSRVIRIYQKQPNNAYNLFQTIGLSADPQDLAVSRDGNTIVVALYGSSPQVFNLSCTTPSTLCSKCYFPCTECAVDKITCSSTAPSYEGDICPLTDCSRDPKCLTCRLLNKIFQCLTCAPNYVLNTDKKCVSAISNCIQYSSDSKCSACESGFKLNSAKTSCLPCTVWQCPQCGLYNQGDTYTCTPCLSSSGYYISNFNCIKCHQSCQTCSAGGANGCLTCASGYQKKNNSNQVKGHCKSVSGGNNDSDSDSSD